VNNMSDQFGKWIGESMPEPTEDRLRSEIHLAVLKERIRAREIKRRKHRSRFGMIAAPAVLVVLISANFVDLGGDGFDLVEIEDSKVAGGVVKNDFREVGFNVQNLESEEEIQEFNHQVAAGQGVVIGLEGWQINGKTHWTIQREFNVLGKIMEMGSSPTNPPMEFLPELPVFLMEHWDEFESKIKSGVLRPSGHMSQELDGDMYSIQYWTIPTEQFGMVIYYSGKPIH